MRSRTKVDVDPGQIDLLVRELLGDDVPTAQVRPLTDGMFNAAYAVRRGDGSEVVVKVAPPSDLPVLTYERDLMRTEIDFYRRAAAAVPVPAVLAADLSRRVLDRDVFVMSCLRGRPLEGARLSPPEAAAVQRELGAAVARLGTVTGDRFGYDRPDGALSAATWSAAFAAMTGAVLADADRFDVRLPHGAARLVDDVARAAPELDVVRVPVLTHFDLWEGNVFVTPGPSGRRLEAVVDGERAFWGDPLAELVSTSLFRDPAEATDFRAGYAEVAGQAPDLGGGARLRLALYRAYLDVIMLVEGAPRGYDGAEHRRTEEFVGRALEGELQTIARELG